jgi:beta-N-acetylhexosaminidase
MDKFKNLVFVCLFLLPLVGNYADETAPYDAEIEQHIHAMTLEQKVGQMFLVSIYGDTINALGRDFITNYQPGGVSLFGSNALNPTQITILTNDFQTASIQAGGVPLFIATDQEGGWIQRLRDGFSQWPPMSLLTASGDADLAFRVGQAMGLELKAVGVNMNLAPVADLDTNIDNPIIGRRSPGSNLDLLAITLPAYIAGLQSVGVSATAKHFPGHGDTLEDSHLTLPYVHDGIEQLRTRELQPFGFAIAGAVDAVMVGHIWFSAIDADQVQPASLSTNIITGILRGEMGYDGVVMTDAMEMNAISYYYTIEQAAVQAVIAGNDMLAFGPNMGYESQVAMMGAIVDAVRGGVIDEERINDSVRRILHAKAERGVLAWQPLEPFEADQRIESIQAQAIIQEMFERGVTVAFNHGNLIPVQSDETVGLIYPAGRLRIEWTCRENRVGLQWSQIGMPDHPSEVDIQNAVNLASGVDRVIVFTDNVRDSIAYQALVKALPFNKTIAVAYRSPYDAVAYPNVGAYMVTYAPHDEALQVACDVLFGEGLAHGRLSTNLPIQP